VRFSGIEAGRIMERISFMSSTTGTRTALHPPGGQAPPAGQEQSATLGLASATGLVVTHDPVAAAYSRRDLRWPADSGRVPRRASRVRARLAGTPAALFGYGDIT
jgi:hypothetical protein